MTERDLTDLVVIGEELDEGVIRFDFEADRLLVHEGARFILIAALCVFCCGLVDELAH